MAVLDQSGAALDPVAAVRVEDPLHLSQGRAVDVTADHGVEAAGLRAPRDGGYTRRVPRSGEERRASQATFVELTQSPLVKRTTDKASAKDGAA